MKALLSLVTLSFLMLTYCITYFWAKGERRNCIRPGEKSHTDSLENKYLINLCVKQNRNTHPRCTWTETPTQGVLRGAAQDFLPMEGELFRCSPGPIWFRFWRGNPRITQLQHGPVQAIASISGSYKTWSWLTPQRFVLISCVLRYFTVSCTWTSGTPLSSVTSELNIAGLINSF